MDIETICKFDGKREWKREYHCFFSLFFLSFFLSCCCFALFKSGAGIWWVLPVGLCHVLNFVKTTLLLSLLRLPSRKKKKKRKKRRIKRGSINFVFSAYLGIFRWNSWSREHLFFLQCKYFKVMNTWTNCSWDTGRETFFHLISYQLNSWLVRWQTLQNLERLHWVFKLHWCSRNQEFQPLRHAAEILDPLESTRLPTAQRCLHFQMRNLRFSPWRSLRH